MYNNLQLIYKQRKINPLDRIIQFSGGYFSYLINKGKVIVVPDVFEGERVLLKIFLWAFNAGLITEKASAYTHGKSCREILPLLYGDTYVDRLNLIVYALCPENANELKSVAFKSFDSIDTGIFSCWECFMNLASVKQLSVRFSNCTHQETYRLPTIERVRLIKLSA